MTDANAEILTRRIFKSGFYKDSFMGSFVKMPNKDKLGRDIYRMNLYEPNNAMTTGMLPPSVLFNEISNILGDEGGERKDQTIGGNFITSNRFIKCDEKERFIEVYLPEGFELEPYVRGESQFDFERKNAKKYGEFIKSQSTCLNL